MLRRSVSQSGLIVELSKHVMEQCEASTPFGRPNSDEAKAPMLHDLLTDLRSLDSAVKQIDNVHSDTHKMMEHLGSIVKKIPLDQGGPERNLSEPYRPMASRNIIPDSPTYLAFQKEIALARQLGSEVCIQEVSPCEAGKVAGDSAIRAQLEEARASNRMMQRALAAVQVPSTKLSKTLPSIVGFVVCVFSHAFHSTASR